MLARGIAGVLLLLNLAAVPPPELRTPTAKWMVEFADNDCIVSRYYGTSRDDAVILAFKRVPMQDGIDVYLIKDNPKTNAWRNGRAKIDFGSGKPIDAKFGAFEVTSGLRRIALSIEDESYRTAVQSGRVSLIIPGESDDSFAVPNFGGALKLLDLCVANLSDAWGIPKDQQTRIKVKAKPAGSWDRIFVSQDYPPDAMQANASGRTVVRYAVDETGHPSDCVVLKQSGTPSLDQRTCSVLMRRGRFKPALDANDKPMRSLMVTGVGWLMFE